MFLDRFRKLPLLGILRGLEFDQVERLALALVDAGLETVEITMNTSGAPALIARMIEVGQGQLTVGAGTVLSTTAWRAAREAGASFFVMPTLVPEVVERCRVDGVPCFPGALTPQEIHAAWSAGATMVKVFPAGVFGPPYFREIKGPFADIELLACGGVTRENLPSYFECGASAVAFGGSVFRKDWLDIGNYERIRDEVQALVEACRATCAQAP